jgi:predicted enzyme related to lactoylglutathione lyase
MARPTHFEIPVDDPDRAEAFYRDIFGWSFQRFEGAPDYYGMATTGPDTDNPGINGALFKRGDNAETTLTMSVDSIEDAVGQITAKGGKVVQEKAPIPGVGYFAVCLDTEGNKFGLFTDDHSATM